MSLDATAQTRSEQSGAVTDPKAGDPTDPETPTTTTTRTKLPKPRSRGLGWKLTLLAILMVASARPALLALWCLHRSKP